MAEPIHCGDCEALLDPHCANAHCSWWTCPTLTCQWFMYDIVKRVRISRSWRLESTA